MINNEINPSSNYLTGKPSVELGEGLQDKIIDQVLLQSGGVGLGFCLAFIAAIVLFKWAGGGSVVSSFLEKIDKGSESLNSLTKALENIAKEVAAEIKENHGKYVKDHEDILDAVSEVKDIIKTDILNQLRDIERKLGK